MFYIYSKSLKAKFLLPVLGFFVIGILASAIINFYVSQNMNNEDVRKLALSRTEKISSKIENKFSTWKTQLELLSSVDEVGVSSKIENNIPKFDSKIFKNYISKRINSKQYRNLSDFDVIARIDIDGNYYPYKGTQSNIVNSDYFKELRKGKDFVISDRTVSHATSKLVIELLIPIEYKNQDWGALSASVPLNSANSKSTLTNIINDKSINENGFAFIMNKKGEIIAHPDESKISENFNYLSKDKKGTDIYKIASKMAAGKEDVEFFYDLANDGTKIKKLISYAPIKNTGWSVAIISNYNDLSRNVPLFLILFIVNLFILFLMVLLISIRLNRLSSNIKKIAESTKEVADGDLSGTNIEFQCVDDICVLANSFNRLRDSLKSIAKRVNELSVNLLYASNSINTSIKTTFDASKGINNSIEKIAKDAADPAKKMSDVLLKIEKIYNSMEDISNQFINISIIVSQYSLQDSKKVNFKEVAEAIKEEARNGISNSSVLKNVIYELGNLGKEIGDISTLIANNSEEISKSTQKQNNELSNMVSTSNKLSEIASELRTLVKYFKVSQQ